MTDKAEARALLRSKRAALENRAELSEAACKKLLALDEYKNAGTVFCYIACGSELDTALIAQAAKKDGKRLCVPVVKNGGLMLAALPDGDMIKNRYGIPEPQSYAVIPPEAITLVITPLIGFDEALLRLGQGGGYYDRFLPLCKNAFVAGLAFEAQKLSAVPSEPHDIPLDVVITEARVYRRRWKFAQNLSYYRL